MSEQPAAQPYAGPVQPPAPTAGQDAKRNPGEPEDGTEAAGKDSSAHEEADDTPLSAEALAGDVGLRVHMRQAGLASLGNWFGGPASFGAGHAAGRDLNINYFGTVRHTASETGPVDPERLRRIGKVHVPGASYSRAKEKLTSSRVVVLRGTDGSGKRTTALHMLGELTGDSIHSVGASQVLGSGDGSGLAESAGHLTDVPETGELTYSRLAALADNLRQLDSYLVITTPAETTTEVDVEDAFIVTHKPPGSEEVVLSHLRQDVDHANVAERLLRESGALKCAATPGAAAQLATHLLDAAENGRDADSLQPTFAEIRRQRARYLLRVGSPKQEDRDRAELLYRRATLISLAVFAGLPHADTIAAAESLVSRFTDIEFSWKRRELFIPWRARLLQEPDITRDDPEFLGPWGPVRAAQVHFTDEELNAIVLETVWQEYESARTPLLEWLHELAVYPRDEAVRVRAAQFAGRLSAGDFGYVCHHLILEWADSAAPRPREAAANALDAVPAALQPHVWQLVSDWCELGNPNLQQAAVLALGTGLHEKRPDEILDRLRGIALRNTGSTARHMGDTVRHSVAELFAGEQYPEAVLRALGAWAADSDLRLRSLARQCVLPLAYVTGVSKEPVLLRVMAGDPTARESAATAIAAALDEPETRSEAWSALEELARVIIETPELTDTLGMLLFSLVRQSSTGREQARFYVRLWNHRYQKQQRENRAGTKEAYYASR